MSDDNFFRLHYVLRSEDRLEVLFEDECMNKNILQMVIGMVDFERRCTQCKKSDGSLDDCLQRHR
jgi:hypothetical protein